MYIYTNTGATGQLIGNQTQFNLLPYQHNVKNADCKWEILLWNLISLRGFSKLQSKLLKKKEKLIHISYTFYSIRKTFQYLKTKLFFTTLPLNATKNQMRDDYSIVKLCVIRKHVQSEDKVNAYIKTFIPTLKPICPIRYSVAVNGSDSISVGLFS